MKKSLDTRFTGAISHIAQLGQTTDERVDQAVGRLHVGDGGGAAATPDGAMGAWEYWGSGQYVETGPDGSYTGGHWSSDC